MKLVRELFPLAVVVVLSFAFCGLASSQGLDPAMLSKPTSDSWPMYHGDYSGQRHSQLTQITPANVGELTLAWAFQTGQAAQIKSSPIVANGILYESIPDPVWPIEALTGSQAWHHNNPPTKTPPTGPRAV